MNLAYLAGLLDGEGCIYTSMSGPGPHYRKVAVAVQMCHPEGPKAFQATFGGTISIRAPYGNTRKMFVWRRSGGIVVSRILTALRPYLRVKAFEADLALALIHRMRQYHEQGYPRRTLPWNEQFIRSALGGLLKAAKKGTP